MFVLPILSVKTFCIRIPVNAEARLNTKSKEKENPSNVLVSFQGNFRF